MKVLLCGGEKTINIKSALKARFKNGELDIQHINSITELQGYLNRGEYTDRLVLFAKGLTDDGEITDENEIRRRLYDLVEIIKSQFSRESTIVFSAESAEMAEIIYEETVEFVSRSIIIIKKNKFRADLLARMASASLDAIDSELVFVRQNKQNEEDENIVYSIDKDNIEAGETLRPVKDSNIDISLEPEPKPEEIDPYSTDEIKDFDSLFSDENSTDLHDFSSTPEDFSRKAFVEIEDGDEKELDNVEVESDDYTNRPDEHYIEIDNGDEEADDKIVSDDEGTGLEFVNDDNIRIDDGVDEENLDIENSGETFNDFSDIWGAGETEHTNPNELFSSDDLGSLMDNDDEIGIMLDGEDDIEIPGTDIDFGIDDDLGLFDDPDNTDTDGFDGTDAEDNNINEFMGEENDELTEAHDGLTIEDDDLSTSDIGDIWGENTDIPDTLEESNLFISDDEDIENIASEPEQPIEKEPESIPDIFNQGEKEDYDDYQYEDEQKSEFDMPTNDENTEESLYDDSNDTDETVYENEEENDDESKSSRRHIGIRRGKKESKSDKKERAARQQSEGGKTRADDLSKLLKTYKTRGTSIVVTGTNGSGKSVTAYNLANIVTKLGYTALIVDMDTKNRAQAYLNRDAYDAVHSLDPENPCLKQALNTSTVGVSRYASIIREGFHVLTMGLAGDIVEGEKLAPKNKLNRFGSNVRNSYTVVIYDMPFDTAVDYASEITITADHVLITCEASNYGMMNLMMAMCNIEDEDMQETIFAHSQICFTKFIKWEKLLGQKIENSKQALLRLDKEVQSLLGIDPEFYFSSIPVCGEMEYNEMYEKAWCSTKAYSDSPAGEREYINLMLELFGRQ